MSLMGFREVFVGPSSEFGCVESSFCRSPTGRGFDRRRHGENSGHEVSYTESTTRRPRITEDEKKRWCKVPSRVSTEGRSRTGRGLNEVLDTDAEGGFCVYRFPKPSCRVTGLLKEKDPESLPISLRGVQGLR